MGKFEAFYHDPEIFRNLDSEAFTKGRKPGRSALLDPIFLANITDPQNARRLARGMSIAIPVLNQSAKITQKPERAA